MYKIRRRPRTICGTLSSYHTDILCNIATNMKTPQFSRPTLTRESLGLTTWVKYDKYNPHSENSTDARKSLANLDYSPLRRVTWASFWMGLLISMGGFIFGYDTGQISGFLEMPDFQERFGQRHDDGTFYFSNVRAGLIVALVSVKISHRIIYPSPNRYSSPSVRYSVP